MHTFSCSSKEIAGDSIVVSDAKKLRHWVGALRLRQGEAVMIFDEEGKRYRCVVAQATKKGVQLSIQERFCAESPSSSVKFALACALPKNVKMDDIVDKLTQLGVDMIIPMVTERVIVRWDEKKRRQHLERWDRIALGASEQSGRKKSPVIEPVEDFADVVKRCKEYSMCLVPCLEGERTRLKDVLANRQPSSLLVMIGPEGDFSQQEISLARQAGCVAVSLGERVLRVDTACQAVAAFVRLFL
jgi:16S rRNA (uracil1498-N3)-methyltransferase